MKSNEGTLILLCFVGSALGSTRGIFPQLTRAQDRVTIKGDPDEILTGWGPMGYFNQFYDPSNIIGPEVLKGFGVPFAAYNGFNLMETMTTPPLQIPDDATSTVPPGYNEYPDLFAPTSDPHLNVGSSAGAKNRPSYSAYNGHGQQPPSFEQPQRFSNPRPPHRPFY